MRGSICAECAHKKGWLWPKGHLATWCDSKCDVCEEEKMCAAMSDWNNPKDPKQAYGRDL